MMKPAERTLLEEGLCSLGLDTAALPSLAAYYNEIELWNPRYKLVAASGRDLVIKHFLDSLAPWRELMAPGLTVFDVGSGGGFPGIPLAICFPDCRFRLIEKSGKRVRFLENVVNLLGLTHVTVDSRDYRQVSEKADRVILRAVTALTEEECSSLLRLALPQGFLGAYKGKRETWEGEIAQWSTLRDWKSAALEVPGLAEERHLIKVFNSPSAGV